MAYVDLFITRTIDPLESTILIITDSILLATIFLSDKKNKLENIFIVS